MTASVLHQNQNTQDIKKNSILVRQYEMCTHVQCKHYFKLQTDIFKILNI